MKNVSLADVEHVDRTVLPIGTDYSPGHLLDWHAHRRAQLLYGATGVMVVDTDDGSWTIPPERAVLIPAATRHRVRMLGVSTRSLYVEPDAVPWWPATCTVLDVSPLLRELLLAAVEFEADYSLSGREGGIATLLLHEIAASTALPFHVAIPASRDLAALCRDYLAAPDAGVTNTSWAAEVAMSERAFTRRFHAQAGESPAAWRTRARLLAAVPLLLAPLPLGAFAALVRRGVRSWWVLLPLAALTWFLVHASGVHATVAGVLLGSAVPVRRPVTGTPARRAQAVGEEVSGLAHHFERRWRPISVGLALPVFAFFAAGVPVGDGLLTTLADPVTLGIVVGLVLGKVVGVSATVAVAQRFTRARLDPSLGPVDVLGAGLLAGLGFTVSLLISELAFAEEVLREHARIGVLTASLVSALLATVVLRTRNRTLRRRATG